MLGRLILTFRVQLLGAQSNDIDVALADMMGVAFAEEFVDMVSSKDLPVKSVATIARNPDQSKHLETARTTVLGIELDFVNLRSESYADDSRIPTEIVRLLQINFRQSCHDDCEVETWHTSGRCSTA